MVKLNVYIIHYDKLTQRNENIDRIKQLANNETSLDITITIVNDHQPENILLNNVKNLVSIDKYPEEEDVFYKNFTKQLSLEILSNTFNHFKAIQLISKNNTEDINVILEDDVQYSDKLFNQLNNLVNNIKHMQWDIIFLGQPSDKNEHDIRNSLELYEIKHENLLLHCCDSYIVNTDTAKNLMLNFFPIRFVYNIQLSYLINKHKYKCYKIFPNICGDGSKMGTYTSSILFNNVLIFNDTYKQIYMLLENKEVLDSNDINMITQLFNNNVLKENPDFLHLEALFYKKIKDHTKCLELFDKAFIKYEEQHCPMNNTSTFLKNYIDVYRIIQ